MIADLFDLCDGGESLPVTGPQEWRDNGVLICPSLIDEETIDRYCEHRAASPHWANEITPYTRYTEIRNLMCHPAIGDKLEEILGGPAGLHLTLLGWRTSKRDWHADVYLNPPHVSQAYAAIWVALQDIDVESGPFEYAPGSHAWPQLSGDKVRNALRSMGMDGDSESWPYASEAILTPLYEKKFAELNMQVNKFEAKKGDVLFWHPLLAHRGSKAVVEGKERRAAIGHYSRTNIRPDMPAAVRHGEYGGWYFPIVR